MDVAAAMNAAFFGNDRVSAHGKGWDGWKWLLDEDYFGSQLKEEGPSAGLKGSRTSVRRTSRQEMLSIALLLVTWCFGCPVTGVDYGDYYIAGGTEDTCPHEKNPEKFFGYRADSDSRTFQFCIVFFSLSDVTNIDYSSYPKQAEVDYCAALGGGLAPFKEAMDDLGFPQAGKISTRYITFDELMKSHANRSMKIDTGFNYSPENDLQDEPRGGRYYKCKEVIVNSTPRSAGGFFHACVEAYPNGTYIRDGHYFPLNYCTNKPKIKEIMFTKRPSFLCEYYIFTPGQATTSKTVLCENRPKDLLFSCYTLPDYNCAMKRVWGCTYREEFKTCYKFRYKTTRPIYKGGFGIPCPTDEFNETYVCECPCNGPWREWTPWSVSCGAATRYRLRTKANADPNKDCFVTLDLDKCCQQNEERIFEDRCEDYIFNTNISLRINKCKNGIRVLDFDTRHFYCECYPGFTGLLCDTSIDACASNPCRYGRCSNVGEHYHCTCKLGYEGINCQLSFEQCGEERKCMNGGNCTDVAQGRQCVCPEGRGGKYCEERSEWCTYGSCSLKGTCFNTSFSTITCLCNKGAYGKHCEIDQSSLVFSNIESQIAKSNMLTIFASCLAVLLILLGCFVFYKAQQKRRHKWRGKPKGGILSHFQISSVETREAQRSREEAQHVMGVSLREGSSNARKYSRPSPNAVD
uniref:EGF-like domain-containing protein n=1 Tax=Trichuris muris TaxID=70415 RepID=A0A5S6QKE3_TRIMR